VKLLPRSEGAEPECFPGNSGAGNDSMNPKSMNINPSRRLEMFDYVESAKSWLGLHGTASLFGRLRDHFFWSPLRLARTPWSRVIKHLAEFEIDSSIGFDIEEGPDHFEETLLIAMDRLAQVETVSRSACRNGSFTLDVESIARHEGSTKVPGTLRTEHLGPFRADGFNLGA